VRLRLEGIPALATTTVTTGVIQATYAVSTAAILGFASRFGNAFDEYRILGAELRITPATASTGVSKTWFDEKATGVPTSNEAQERTNLPLANTNAMSKSQRVMRWRARDLLDLQYTPIGTVIQPVTWKLYTDAANWAAPVTATTLFIIESVLTIEMRGIKST